MTLPYPDYKRICVVGDANSGGGIAIGSLQQHSYIDGNLILVNGSPVSAHLTHGATATANGSGMFLIDGMFVNVVGDADACGHVRV